MASVQLFARNVLAFALFSQSTQGHNFGCGAGECDAQLTFGSTVEKPGSGVLLARMCTSECRKGGSSYYWCDADTIQITMEGSEIGWNGWPISWGWDYCSPQKNTDITGKQCASNHGCGNHGYGYRWCYTNTGHTSWNYCSIEPLTRVKMPRVIIPCNDLSERKDNPRCLSTG